MAFIDYYKILGVKKDIPQSDVREAYRKRAKQFHPDLHPNDPKAKAKFQALNEAYDVIGDSEKRKKYDAYGEHWKDIDAAGGFGGGNTWNSSEGGWSGFHNKFSGDGGSPFDGFDFCGFDVGGASNFFNDFFGGSSRRSSTMRKEKGERHATVNIDLYTAILGGSVIIQLGDGSKIRMNVKPGTQNGGKVRLRGKGDDCGNGVRGDMILTYNVQIPTNLSERQKQLLREMRNS